MKSTKIIITTIFVAQILCAIYLKFFSHFSISYPWINIYISIAKIFSTIAPLLYFISFAGIFVAPFLLITFSLKKDAATIFTYPYHIMLLLECTFLPALIFYCVIDALV